MADESTGQQFKGSGQQILARKRLEKAREKMLESFASERERIVRDNQVNIGSDKFVSQALDVEQELKRDTVGLVHLDEFQRIREQLEAKKRKAQELQSNNKKLKKNLIDKGKLSFDDDMGGGDDDDEYGGGAGGAGSHVILPKKLKKKKDPSIDTSFLPDKEREEKERALRQRLKEEWLEKQEDIKVEEISVDVSFWDGTGHRKNVMVSCGSSSGPFYCV